MGKRKKPQSHVRPLSRLNRSFKQLENTYWDIRRIYGRWRSGSKFIKKAFKEDQEVSEKVTPDALKKILATEDKYAKLIRMQSFIFYVGMFEYFIRKSYEACLLNNSKLCFPKVEEEFEEGGQVMKQKNSTKQIPLEKIFQNISINDLRTFEIQRMARKWIEHRPFEKVHSFFSENIKFTHVVPPMIIREIERARQTRHLILHNGGRIDQKFIDRKFAKQYQYENKIDISRKFLSMSNRTMMTYAKVLHDSIEKILAKK